MAVLGSMLIERDAVEKAVDVLIEKDFYQDSHRKIFAACVELYRRGSAVDLVTVSEELNKTKLLSDIGGATYLTELLHKVATAAHVDYYAKLVKDKALLRDLINAATSIVSNAYSAEKETSELLDQAQANIMKVAERQSMHSVAEAKDLAHPTLERIEKAHKNKSKVTGVSSGLNSLDWMTTGFQKGDLVLLAARPSQGKTALCLNIASNIALHPRDPKPVLIFSLEMSKESIMDRFIAAEAGVDLKSIKTGYFPREKWTDLTNAAARLSEAPLMISDASALSVLSVRSIARQCVAEQRRRGKELGIVIIDYLQLMRGSSFRTESRQQEVSEISRGLKGLARDLQLPVLALSQLSRRTEEKGRTDGRPQLSDLRESGALEQDADLVMFIYREAQYKQNDPTVDDRKAEIIVAKNRQGPTGTADVQFLRHLTKFVDATTEQEPEGGAAVIEDAQTAFS